MLINSWLSTLATGISRTRAGNRVRNRKTLAQISETLEDRVLLSTLYVDDSFALTNDTGTVGLSNGDTVTFAPTETAETTGLTFGVNAFSQLDDAIAAAQATGDEILIASGTYVRPSIVNVNKSVSIRGVGDDVDDVVLLRSGLRAHHEDRVIEVLAPNVTISHLKVGGWQNVPTVAELGSGYDIWTTQVNTTLDDVQLDSDDMRGAVYFANSGFTLKDSLISGTYFRGAVRGGGAGMTISGNKFEESHFWYSPIYLDDGAAISGTIDHNYFANRIGVNNDTFGDFKEDGTGLYAITNYVPQNTAAAGLTIEYNTFDFQDSNLVNSSGNQPSASGVYIEPSLPAGGPITIQNNIFQGYQYTGPGAGSPPDVTATAPVFQPAGGQPGFGGALNFDGVDDFAAFSSPLFDVGEKGSLSFWVKMDNPGKRNEFFEGPDNGGFEMQYRNNSGGQIFGRVDSGSGDFVIRSGGDNTTNWINVQYTWNFNASDKMHIYVNGTESTYLSGFAPTDLVWSQIIDTTEGVMNVGRDAGDLSRSFDGLMDDVAWFDEVLTPAQLSDIRATPVGNASPASRTNLVAYWNMDDAVGTLIVPGDAGTAIPLYLGTSPLPPPAKSSAIIAPSGTLVDYNLFNDNEQNFNAGVTDGGHNLTGDPRFVGTGADPEDYYALKFGSPAINASSDFPGGGIEQRHIGAFQGVPVPPANIVYVDDDWSSLNYGDDPDGAGPALFFGVDSFATIQEAINLVDADGTVIVYAGTYAENLTINKNVTIDGDGPDDTYINGASGIGIIIVDPTTDVTLKDLKIAGTPTARANTATAADLTLENVILINIGSSTQVFGSNQDDTIELRNNAGVIEVQINGGGWASIPDDVALAIEGLDGSDLLSIDYTGGDPVPTGGLVFNAGNGLSDGMELKVQGDVNYTPDATTTGNGVITVGTKTINFRGLEPVDFDFIGPGVFTLTLPGADDIVDIANGVTTVGGLAALVLSGSSNAVDFETAHVRGASEIVVDTTTVAGTDEVTITSANNAHNNAALTINEGTETDDVITVDGTATFTGTTTLNGSTINLNANITNAVAGTTATEVNVNNSTAQIQDGVDAAAAGATVNVAGGFTYAEAVTVDQNLSLVATGTSGNATISATTGPALTVSAGTVDLTGFNATTSFASSTILVTGGSLKLRQNSIVKSATAPGAAIIATGAGVLNLGANPAAGTADPGQNSITGTGALLSSATDVDASGNWWGSSVQATIGAALSANVDYSPFLNSGTDISATTPGFQSSFDDITVHTDGPQTGPDPRITEGYNTLAATGTIHVLTGTYTENVDLGAAPVDKAVTFAAGASPGQVAIVGNVVFTSNDTLPVELNGLATALFDNFTVTGTIDLNGDNNVAGGANLVVTVGYGAVPYDRFTIFNNDSTDAVTGTFKNLPEGSIISVGGVRLRLSYTEFHNTTSTPPTPIFYGDGNDISLTVMTPPILVTTNAKGDLTIDGTGWNDDIILEFTGTNTVRVIGNDVSNFTGPGTGNSQIAGPYIVTGNLTVRLGNGKDKVLIRGVGAGASLDSGDLTIDLGSDDDVVTTIDTSAVPVATTGVALSGSLTILGGLGLDNITLGSDAANDTITALNVNIDTGTGAGAQTISLDRFTANGNVTLANGGAGAQTVSMGSNASAAPNSIRGNLIINQLASASSYTVGVRNTSVGGFVQITNGNGSGAAAVTINTTTTQTIGGSTTITNGNNLTNAVSLIGNITGPNLLRLAGNVTVKNGDAGTSNTITVTDIVNSGTTSSSFTNGSSPANTITFSGADAAIAYNTFLGVVTATNGASSGANVINATRLSSTKGINLVNGAATTSNDVAIGGAGAADLVSVTGNLVITNGVSADIDVDINNLTTLGANAVGNVTMTNAATGAGGTTVTLGASAANSISGNLQITNQTSTGLRSLVMNRTTISGRNGANLYNVGAGDTSLTVGNNQLVTIAKGLVIEDGTGAAAVNLLNLTTGGLNYKDLGGGVDTLNLADTAGTLRVNGVTRIDTGASSDTVRIATTGTAFFNDTVFIALGTGNDLLFIGANADSPAFSGASKFQFDGGAGTDTLNASPLSIAEYDGSPLKKKVKSKILNFENLLTN